MRSFLAIGLATVLAVAPLSAQKKVNRKYMDSSLSPEKRAELLLKQMTLEEKIGQMCQYVGPCYVPPGQGSPYKNIDATDDNLGKPDIARKVRAGEVGSFLHVLTSKEAAALQNMALESRLGIPLLLGIDAVHGNALHENCTIYPANLSVASSFDLELAETIGRETADEMRQTGMHWTFAPNLDVARDARWGRMGETYGEDPFLVSQMGKYTIWGLQGREADYSNGVLACAKHLIGGGEPAGGINAAPMDMSERKMRELYLPPFIAAVQDAHVATVMAAHNELNGVPCHGNSYILQDILRDELGFKGFVVSDWMDIERMHSMHHWVESKDEAFVRSVEAGVDMHMQGDGYFDAVLAAVKSGRLSEKRINDVVRKILVTKFQLGLFENPVPEVRTDHRIDRSDAHRETALMAAREGIVLLKNNGILPLDPKMGGKIFVVGPNADSQTILGDWAAPQPDENVITVLGGVKEVFRSATIESMCFDGRIMNVTEEGVRQAAEKAREADLNIVVVGENSQRYSPFGCTCGENNDRDNLDLPGLQQELLEAVYASGKPTVLVLLNGRALSLVWADENVPAIVEGWECGMMGGRAIAEILVGQVNPSGKLPVTVPRNVGQVQTVYNYKWSQYSRKFALTKTGCLYPFGYGLSYTSFEYSTPVLSAAEIKAGESVKVSFDLTNTGKVEGTETVQLYIRDEYGSVTRPVKELKDFCRVSLKVGEKKTVEFEITPKMLECFGAQNKWSVEPGDFTIMIGGSSADKDQKTVKLTVR